MAEQIEIRVPDIGDFEDVEVVEILVAPGDQVQSDEPIVSIESDKATMEVPTPAAGLIVEMRVSLGDLVSEGSVLALLEKETQAEAEETTTVDSEDSASPEAESVEPPSVAASAPTAVEATSPPKPGSEQDVVAISESPTASIESAASVSAPHAGPGVRRFARELGVDLTRAEGRGPHGRILPEDVKDYVRSNLQGSAASGLSQVPTVDFSRYGPVKEEPLPKIRRVAAKNLSRSWLTAPHVTQHDEADVTEMERFRRECKEDAARQDLKLSPLHFALKAVASALREFPDFRSSLSPDGGSLLVKEYFHLGVAVDTENGLVVPVLRDVDQKGIFELARELAEAAERARSRKLAPADMQGAVFTLSSLGGIGGTAFTPIVNVPEVSILGLSKLEVKPQWSGGTNPEAGGHFEPRVMLPLSLSYDHRVIDGASAARFTTRLAELLSHPAHLLL